MLELFISSVNRQGCASCHSKNLGLGFQTVQDVWGCGLVIISKVQNSWDIVVGGLRLLGIMA